MFGLFKKKPAPAEPDVSRIVPRIKHTNFLVAIRDLGAGVDDTPVTEPLVADLLVTYAFDLPDTFQMFTHRDMKALGMTVSQVRTTAVANLRAQIAQVHTEGQPPVLMIVSGNDLEACLLLLDDVWESLSSNVPGKMVVAIPTRDIVFLTSSESPEGLQVVREAIVESQKHDTTHSLTQQLLIWSNGKWEVFDGVV